MDHSKINWTELALGDLSDVPGRIAVIVAEDGKMGPEARKLNSLTKRSLARLVEGPDFEKMDLGDVARLDWPSGMEADAILVVKLPKRPEVAEARRAGAGLARLRGKGDLLVLSGASKAAEDIALGLMLRSYRFEAHKTATPDAVGQVTMMVKNLDEIEFSIPDIEAVAAGAYFTRDLVNAPANVLTTTEFATQLQGLSHLGIEVQVLEEAELEALGMGSLLCVGQGSDSPSKVVVMKWNGGGDEAPLALVGKGVVFDTGGISLKPGAGMEDMTMDMGGAGVVSGVMKTLALRRAKANVVGLVGLVENMPSGNAVRPGDIVTSMKGDTIEVINTDAEGRLVLADVLWYAQETFAPAAMINLATLTGAIVVALGAENAGVFSNDDNLAAGFLAAAEAEGEGAWRMPMGAGYDRELKSRVADMKNIGGRPGGAVTAAQFLGRFVKDDVPWAHLDIAGVTLIKDGTEMAPAGATGWGVMSLNRLVADRFEQTD